MSCSSRLTCTKCEYVINAAAVILYVAEQDIILLRERQPHTGVKWFQSGPKSVCHGLAGVDYSKELLLIVAGHFGGTNLHNNNRALLEHKATYEISHCFVVIIMQSCDTLQQQNITRSFNFPPTSVLGDNSTTAVNKEQFKVRCGHVVVIMHGSGIRTERPSK